MHDHGIPVSDRDKNFDRYRDSAEIGPFLPVPRPGLTGTGIGDKTESAGIRLGLTFRHRDVTGMSPGFNMLHIFRGN